MGSKESKIQNLVPSDSFRWEGAGEEKVSESNEVEWGRQGTITGSVRDGRESSVCRVAGGQVRSLWRPRASGCFSTLSHPPHLTLVYAEGVATKVGSSSDVKHSKQRADQVAVYPAMDTHPASQ